MLEFNPVAEGIEGMKAPHLSDLVRPGVTVSSAGQTSSQGVDIIHGHSSHHVQGVEVYKNKPIIYGCGDFVDDYAIDPAFRNDISALWRVIVEPKTGADNKLEVKKVEIYPTFCRRFIASRLEKNNPDYAWVKGTFQRLSRT